MRANEAKDAQTWQITLTLPTSDRVRNPRKHAKRSQKWANSADYADFAGERPHSQPQKLRKRS
jgi:hypothetical protein